MAVVYPDFMTISKLRTPATEGEFFILNYLSARLDSSFEIFFNPFLDGDRPDIIILRKGHGAVIIEVKDWRLTSYSVSADNKWAVLTPEGKRQRIKSPHQQAFHYKTNMYDLHLPLLGMCEAINNNFFRVIHPFVYFHNSTENDIRSLYESSFSELSAQNLKLNIEKNNGNATAEIYNKRADYIARKLARLERDRRMSYSTDIIDKLVKKINAIGKNILFSEEIYEEFKRRLSPSEWTYLQGEKIEFDATQQKYTQSTDEQAKVKGVAGCGKTSIIAARALDAYNRHGSVLILTFNLTLKPLIRDKLSHINFHSINKADANSIEITNYHRFFVEQLNYAGIEIEVPNSNKKEQDTFWDELVKDASHFKDKEHARYRSIFIDEIQDYEKEWITIVRDCFLEPGGEMVLFGDQAQNIYQRDEEPLNKAIVRGFGRWGKLTKSYRINVDSLLVFGFKQFQEHFLLSRHEDLEVFESKMYQMSFADDASVVFYQEYDTATPNDLAQKIDIHIKKNKFVPNDIAIISSRIEILRNIESFFRKQEKMITMFVTDDDIKMLCANNRRYEQVLLKYDGNTSLLRRKDEKTDDELSLIMALDKIEKRKKNFFMQNSGLIKLSTLHSFKGMEAKTVFCVLHESDSPEVVYTAITRAKQNLVIFGAKGNAFASFFNDVYGAERV